MTNDQLTVTAVPALKDNYIWTIIDRPNQAAVVVDPGDATPILDFLQQENLLLKAVLITHHHADHTNGIAEIRKKFSVPIVAPAHDNVIGVTDPVTENNIISLGGHPEKYHVIGIPGHTLGHVAYYSPGKLFCGDTLFSAGCGKIFEGTPPQMFATLQRLMSLPDTTEIYCGHEYTLTNLYFAEMIEPGNQRIKQRIQAVSELRDRGVASLPSTLKIERYTNPFLRCHVPEVVAIVEKYAGKRLGSAVEVFTWLRRWKDGI